MFRYIILGIVQGLTEFLPVSSSAHLLMMQKVLGLDASALAVSVILHLGTILALLLFFFKDILAAVQSAKLWLLIIAETVITAIIGLSAKGFFESLFSGSGKFLSLALALNGLILIWSAKFQNARRDILDIQDALILGFTQGVAIIPGISRSGLTISTLLLRRVDKETAFRFSFLACIPAVLGATLLEIKKIDLALQAGSLNLIVGFIFSFLSGLFALWILRRILAKARWHYFGYYCILVAIINLWMVR